MLLSNDTAALTPADDAALASWLADPAHHGDILTRTLEHLQYSLVATLLGVVLMSFVIVKSQPYFTRQQSVLGSIDDVEDVIRQKVACRERLNQLLSRGSFDLFGDLVQ